jgi:CheY-like chemotaxis protein
MKNTRKILVVDDTPVDRLVPGMILRPFGYEVYEAADGSEVMSQLCAQQISLVLLDLAMPEMTGQQALRLIRSLNDSRRSLPVVAYTTVENDAHATELLAMGFDHVLAKPARSTTLLQKIDKWLSTL